MSESKRSLSRSVHRLVPLVGERRASLTLLAGFGLRMTNLALRLLLAIVLARVLGPEGYGSYSIALALVTVLAIPVQMGLPVLVERETARAQAVADWPMVNTVWRWSFLMTSGLSLLVILCLSLLLVTAPRLFPENLEPLLLSGMLLIPLLALSAIRGAALRGLRRVVLGQLPEALVLPVVFLTLFSLMAWLLEPSPQLAMLSQLSAASTAFVTGAWLLHRARPAGTRDAGLKPGASRAWLSSVFTLALVAGLQLLNSQVGVLLLGYFSSAGEVGIYRVAASAVVLVPMVLQVVSVICAPQFARLYAQGDMAELKALVTRSSRLIAVLSLPVVCAYLALAAPLLQLCFGTAYLQGEVALRFLVAGQSVNVLTGCVVALLAMTRNERTTLRGLSLASVINLALCLLWIPAHGMDGAAAALAVSMASWNLVQWWSAWRTLGVDASPLGLHRSAATPHT